MKYIKEFKTHSEYETYINNNPILPNVSYCEDLDDTHYNPIYSKLYLTIKSLEDNNVIGWKSTYADDVKTISISIDNGSTWESKTSSTEGVTLATLNSGESILVKGINDTYAISYPPKYTYFTSTGDFYIQGNIMSLINGDNFKDSITLIGDYTFEYLFKNCTKLTSIKNLILPATTLTEGCYAGMFFGCTALTDTPKLPATTLSKSCYNGMFGRCTSLVIAPELPATTLAINCYAGMFQDCTSLTEAPELPVMTLVELCYAGMFHGCTSLTTAPELPALTLQNNCYTSMFQNCTILNYVKAMFTTVPTIDKLETMLWLAGVAESGTFVKNRSAYWDTDERVIMYGMGIPSGWTVETAIPN